jgi:AcrR family transcriptional regulator
MPASKASVRPDAPPADVRDRIVASALRHFAAKGYAGASLREIAEAARTTKPMIYYYFKHKEGLYTDTLSALLQQFAEAIDRATPRDGTPETQLRAFCDAYLRYFQTQEPHVAFVVREVFGLGADVVGEFGRILDERVNSRLRRILEEGIARGEFACDDVESATVAITGILTMFILRRIFGGVELDSTAAVSQVMDFYVAGMRARAHRGPPALSTRK